MPFRLYEKPCGFCEPIRVLGRQRLRAWLERTNAENEDRFSSHLYSESPESPMLVEGSPAQFTDESPVLDGYLLLQRYFDSLFARDPRVVALGEDVGLIGDVNQGFAGLQEKFGEIRITDTGIRETTIIGQGIGMAMRGLRPIVEIQYFDYVYYALATLNGRSGYATLSHQRRTESATYCSNAGSSAGRYLAFRFTIGDYAG